MTRISRTIVATLVALTAPGGVALAQSGADRDDRYGQADAYDQRGSDRADRERRAHYDDDDVTLDELPRAVQDTIRRETRGATITEIEREVKHGKTHYEVEFRDGRDRYEMHVASDGRVLLLERDE